MDGNRNEMRSKGVSDVKDLNKDHSKEILSGFIFGRIYKNLQELH